MKRVLYFIASWAGAFIAAIGLTGIFFGSDWKHGLLGVVMLIIGVFCLMGFDALYQHESVNSRGK